MRLELLKNIADIIAGQSPPSATYNKSGSGVPFFQGKADFGDKFPVTRNWCSQPTKIALPNDVLISVRAPVGSVNINNTEACIGRGLSAIRAKQGYWYEYIYYFLKANEIQISKLGVGSTFTAITQKDLSNLEIVVPDNFEEQRRISKILSQAEILIKQRKESIALLDEFLRSTFLKMFGDPVRNEKGWEKKSIKSFGKIVTGNTPPRSNSKNYDSKDIEWIKSDNIIEDELYLTEAQEYLSATGRKHAREVKEGAILVTCIAGSLKSIGRAALSNRKVSFNQQINAIQPNSNTNSLFLYWLFKLSRSYIQSYATKGMKRILTKSIFENISLISPEIRQQNQFGSIVQQLELVKLQCKKGLGELENLYGSLSQRFFKPSQEVEDKRYGDPFEVDEETAKAQGEWFYKEWRRLNDRNIEDDNLKKIMEYAVHPERIPIADKLDKIDLDGPNVEHFAYAGKKQSKKKTFEDVAYEALDELLHKHPNGFSFAEFRTYLIESKKLDSYQETKEFVFDLLEKGELVQYFATPSYMRAAEDPLFNPPGGDNLRDALVWLMPAKTNVKT